MSDMRVKNECFECGDRIDPIRIDGMFWDGDEIECDCGALNGFVVDADGGYCCAVEPEEQ